VKLRRRGLSAAAALLAAACLLALGVWQLERRVWKQELVAAVDARLKAAPVAVPGPGSWPALDARRDAYRRVRATGRFRHEKETLVQAVTVRGRGFWVLTPLVTPRFTLLVNRGFIPPDRRDPASRRDGNPDGPVTVTGFLRISEPGGGFLRSNRPADNLWYSRDVEAIAAARGLERVAPYFVDADASSNAGGYPVGGLTIVVFRDHHLLYALTWFALAGLALLFAWRILKPYMRI